MKLLFVDTGAFYALADRRDPAHERARSFYEACNRPFVTTDFVFAETMSLLTKRLGKHTAVRFGAGIRRSSRFRIDDATPQVREAAWQLFSSQPDKDYDLIDCTSFALMTSLKIDEAFGFDRHFTQHGLRLLP
jgi:uncharacterized protein